MTKKSKAKSGIGRGTGKKGWNRWKAGANKAKSAKPYTSKRTKKDVTPKEGKDPETEWIDG